MLKVRETHNKAPKNAFAPGATAGRFNLRFKRPLARRYVASTQNTSANRNK